MAQEASELRIIPADTLRYHVPKAPVLVGHVNQSPAELLGMPPSWIRAMIGNAPMFNRVVRAVVPITIDGESFLIIVTDLVARGLVDLDSTYVLLGPRSGSYVLESELSDGRFATTQPDGYHEAISDTVSLYHSRRLRDNATGEVTMMMYAPSFTELRGKPSEVILEMARLRIKELCRNR